MKFAIAIISLASVQSLQLFKREAPECLPTSQHGVWKDSNGDKCDCPILSQVSDCMVTSQHGICKDSNGNKCDCPILLAQGEYCQKLTGPGGSSIYIQEGTNNWVCESPVSKFHTTNDPNCRILP